MGEIRLHGRGGQGTVMAAEMLANAFVRQGKYASVFPSFGIERRGSAVQAFVRYGDQPIREKTKIYRPEMLLALDPTLLDKKDTYEGFKTGGVIVAAAKDHARILAMGVKPSIIGLVDGMEIAYRETGTNITNVVMLGALAKVTGLIGLGDVTPAVEENFSGELLRKNLIVLKRGHDEAKVIKFDTQAGDDDAVSLFEIKKTSCLEPKTAVFESSWSDCTNKVQIIKTGEWRFKRPVTNKDDCRRCGLCALYCPVGCVTERPSGHYLQDYAYCKGCGVCAFECPAGAIDMVLEEE